MAGVSGPSAFMEGVQLSHIYIRDLKVEHPPPIWTTPMQWATAILICGAPLHIGSFYHSLYIAMSQANSIAKNCRLRSSNFYITINNNKCVVLADQLTQEEEAYFQRFDTAWRRYFNQSPDVWLKFLMPGDNTKNSIKSIDSLARAELQLSRRLMIHAHMLIEIKHYTKVHLVGVQWWCVRRHRGSHSGCSHR